MRSADDARTEENAQLPAAAALAADRAGLPDPKRAFVADLGAVDSRPTDGEGAGDPVPGLLAAWADRRHVIVRSGPRLSASDAADRLRDAGVSADTPALLASGLGTGSERLLYGSLEDVRGSSFGVGAVLLVPHPATLPMTFAWPPAAAPAEEGIG